MDEFQDHLARINCVLGQAAVELTPDAYFELLVELYTQIEADILNELGEGDAEGEDREGADEDEGADVLDPESADED